MKTFTIAATLTYEAVVEVKAEDAEDAKARFDAGNWQHEQTTQLLDWASRHAPKEIK